MSLNRHNNTPTSPRSVIGNAEYARNANQNVTDLVTPLRRSTRQRNALPRFSPIEENIARNLREEFAQEAPRYNLRSQTQRLAQNNGTIPTTLSEQFANITRNARRNARLDLGLDDSSTNGSINSIQDIDNQSFNSRSSNTSSNASRYEVILPINESPITQFNTSPALLDASVNILEHFSEQQERIGLNEEHYRGLSNDFGHMHTNATMTAETIRTRLNQLFDNPITQEQHNFLMESQRILNNRGNRNNNS